MIKVDDISKSYGATKALINVSFTIEKGEIVGFLGPNGAGKSTMMKIMNSYLPADTGSLEIGGVNMFDNSLEVRKNVGYLPENNPLYGEMYVREYLEFVADIYKIDHSEIETVIEKTGLLRESRKAIKDLSKGYKQRVGLAAAIIHNPDYLILDEPTTGLDPNQIVEIRELIKSFAKEKTVLLSTHIMQEVEAMCERVIIIKEGQILKDQPLSNFTQGNAATCRVEFQDSIKGADLSVLEGVLNASSSDGVNFKIEYESDNILDVLNSYAISSSNVILNFNLAKMSLEESFRELTK